MVLTGLYLARINKVEKILFFNFSAILVSYVVLVRKQLHKWPINLGIFQSFIYGPTLFCYSKFTSRLDSGFNFACIVTIPLIKM